MFASLPVDPNKFSAFLVAMTFLAISPGPANLFFIRTGLAGSKLRVLFGVMGTNVATLVWFIASALGLQALMTAFPLAFQVIAIAGGIYVGWLGFQTFRKALKLENEAVDPAVEQPASPRTPWQTLREGFMVQLLNPKALLFFTAVLPPFMDISRPLPPQLVVFAAAMISLDMLSMSTYGFLAVRLSRLLRDPHNKQRFDLASGGILLVIGVIIAWHGFADVISPQLTSLTYRS